MEKQYLALVAETSGQESSLASCLARARPLVKQSFELVGAGDARLAMDGYDDAIKVHVHGEGAFGGGCFLFVSNRVWCQTVACCEWNQTLSYLLMLCFEPFLTFPATLLHVCACPPLFFSLTGPVLVARFVRTTDCHRALITPETAGSCYFCSGEVSLMEICCFFVPPPYGV